MECIFITMCLYYGSKTSILGRIRIGTRMSLLHHWLTASLEFSTFLVILLHLNYGELSSLMNRETVPIVVSTGFFR